MEEYQKKINDSEALVKIAKKSTNSSITYSQYAYQVENTLDSDRGDPLYLLVRTPLNLAKRLAKGGTERQESLEDLWSQLYCQKVWVRRILKDARFAETVRAANTRINEVVVAGEQPLVLEEDT